MALERVAAADSMGDPYQLVFTDWQMPGMNGTETCHALRKLDLRLRALLMAAFLFMVFVRVVVGQAWTSGWLPALAGVDLGP